MREKRVYTLHHGLGCQGRANDHRRDRCEIRAHGERDFRAIAYVFGVQIRISRVETRRTADRLKRSDLGQEQVNSDVSRKYVSMEIAEEKGKARRGRERVMKRGEIKGGKTHQRRYAVRR